MPKIDLTPSDTLKRRVYISFAVVVVALSVLLTLVFFREYRVQLREDVRERLRDIVAVAAVQIDAAAHNRLRSPEQEGGPTYLRLRRDLQRVRDAATGIRYVYTMVASADGQIMFVLDAETNPDEIAHLGDIYDDASELLAAHFATLDGPLVEQSFYTDKWGTWLTGYAPFYTPDGERAGVVGVDIEASDIVARERHLLLTLLPLLAAVISLILLLSLAIGRWLAKAAARALAALHANEEKLRNIVEHSTNLFYAHTPDHVLTYLSPQSRQFLGCEPQEGERRWTELVTDHPINQEGFALTQRAIDTGERQRPYELQIERQDGRRIWVQVNEAPVLRDGKTQAIVGALTDITERRAAEEALREQGVYLESILRSSTRTAIAATDPQLCITYFNPTAERVFGLDARDVIGKTVHEIHAGKVDPVRFSRAVKTIESEGEFRFTVTRARDGQDRFIDVSLSAIRGHDGQPGGFVLIGEDVTRRRRDAELIAHQASYDALTDLPNRRLLLDRLGQALVRCRSHERRGALLFLDLDQFKHINDSLGHPAGDILLQQVASRLRTGVREEDTAARLGGDEFVVVLSETDGDSEAVASYAQLEAERIRDLLSRPYRVNGLELHVTPSIGVTLFPLEGEGADDLLKHADTAMYRAKDAGRNSICFFLPSMQEAAEQLLGLKNDLRLALERGELLVHFQPEVDRGGAMVGMEALVRWQHPRRGLVPPDAFVPVAEDTGQIVEIGAWVLASALDHFRKWMDDPAGARLKGIAVNVSPRQFAHADFVALVERTLAVSGVEPVRLTLEITEGVLLGNLDDATLKMQVLKDLGVRFSIDDFGTGYSSLAYLRRLPVDELKIDRSFVRDLLTDPGDAGLVETILGLAQHMDLGVVAEGVESEEQFRFLLDRGCRRFQGFYFHPPAPASVMDALLRERAASVSS